ncbi:MAG: helix-turn-helix domain-containing protein [Rhizobiales bacterium]|nr:helix-turn-helix domain-containing protein [Hyphomicrobiales bacterium]
MTRAAVSRAWSWRHAITRSGLSPTTRHVLLTLSIFMDEAGGSCFPPVDDIVAATGLSKRAVLTHLEAACEAGWLRKQAHGYRGQKWRRQEYEALWPERDVVPREDDADASGAGAAEAAGEAEGGERGAPPSSTEVVNVVHEGGERGAPKVVNVVHQDKDQSSNLSKTSPAERERGRATGQEEHPGEAGADGEGVGLPGEAPRPTRAEMLEADWLALKAVWPDMALQAHGAARAKLAELKAAERRAAIEAVPAFLAFHREKRGKRPLPYLVNYLGERRWEDLPKRPAGGGEGDAPAPVGAYDRAWWRLFFDWLERHGSAVGDHRGAPGQWLARKCSAARGGMPWIIQRGELAELEERALRLVQVPLLGREADAWRAHLRAAFGIDLPKPDRAEWIWVPSADPAGWGEGTSGERMNEVAT